MGGIFISNRRGDSGPYTGRLGDTLSRHFGEHQVFRDLATLVPGERFTDRTAAEVSRCDALLAVIGPKWLTITDETRQRRIDNPNDVMRQEIAIALTRRDVLVIPVLVGDAVMPRREQLPPDLAPLADINAIRLTEEGYDHEVGRLIRALEPVLNRRRAPAPAPFRPPPPSKPRSKSTWPFVAVIAVAVVALLIGGSILVMKFVSGLSDTIVDFGPGNATVVLSPSKGPPGTVVNVAGTGYGKEETVEILFHATEVGTVLTNPDGSFTTQITVPDTPFRDQQFDISATGKQTIRHDSAPFQVT